MSDINDQFSDTSSDLNWPLDHATEHQIPDDRVVFENVADQYVKGADVTAFFTILNDLKINPDQDEIGLLRVGYTNIKECVAYAPVQLSASTLESTRHGTAIFPAASLPVTDDEFYQFCYILNKRKNLGSSIPFQLNCASDDIDLLSNKPIRNTKSDGFIGLADQDNDDLIVIHTKHVLTEEKLRQENRQLVEINRRLESQKDEYKSKLEFLEAKAKEQSQKVYNEMQTLTAAQKTLIDELSARKQSESKLHAEYDACIELCNRYQVESLQKAERCRTLEDAHAKILNEANQIRSQLAITSQLTKDQATQIVDLEHRLMQANEILKLSNQKQALIEEQLRDLRLASEKNRTDFDTYEKQAAEKLDEINSLKAANKLLEDEVNTLKSDNGALSIIAEKEQELENQVAQLHEQHYIENEAAQKEIELLKSQLNDMQSHQQAYLALKASFTEIEKRCVKHQKSELDVKRQLAAHKDFINDLQKEVQDLTDRLSAGADEYKTLFRKYTTLERKLEVNEQHEQPNIPILVNGSIPHNDILEDMLRIPCVPQLENKENRNEEQNNATMSFEKLSGENFVEVQKCPMCFMEFTKNITLAEKEQHINQHFE